MMALLVVLTVAALMLALARMMALLVVLTVAALMLALAVLTKPAQTHPGLMVVARLPVVSSPMAQADHHFQVDLVVQHSAEQSQ
jgi:hypothetical protein